MKRAISNKQDRIIESIKKNTAYAVFFLILSIQDILLKVAVYPAIDPEVPCKITDELERGYRRFRECLFF